MQEQLKLDNQKRVNQYKEELGQQLSYREQYKIKEFEEYEKEKQLMNDRIQEYNK